MPPPWATIDTLPGFWGTKVKLAYTDTSGSAFWMPWLLGPKMRMPLRWAAATISRSRASPSGPTSLKPAEWTMANFTPFFPHSSSTFGTNTLRMEMFTRSTSQGTSRIDSYACMLRITPPLGLTGKTGPLNPYCTRLRTTMWPMEYGLAEAPITATARGRKSPSSILIPFSSKRANAP